jgi:hypothetical protein
MKSLSDPQCTIEKNKHKRIGSRTEQLSLMNIKTKAIVSILLMLSSLSLPLAGKAFVLGTRIIKLNNFNQSQISGAPSKESRIRINSTACLRELKTYHFNGGQPVTPGRISLKSEDGKTIGDWQAEAQPATPVGAKSPMPGLFWTCHPDYILKPGTYIISPSDQTSWSSNSRSGNRGFFSVRLETLPLALSNPLPENLNAHGIPFNLKDLPFTGNFKETWDYSNQKFDFIVRYPCALIPQDESDDGNGQEFKAKDGSGTLRAFGSVQKGATLEGTLRETLKAMSASGEEINSKWIADDWFLIEGKKGDFDVLTKVIVTNSKVLRFELSYLDSRSSDYDPLAKRMAAAFSIAHQSDYDPVANNKPVVLPAANETSGSAYAYQFYESCPKKFIVEYPTGFTGDFNEEMFTVQDPGKTITVEAKSEDAEDMESGQPITLDYNYHSSTGFSTERQIAHKERGKNWFKVISVDKNNMVTYLKVLAGKSINGKAQFKEVSITYPLSRHAELAAMAKRVTNSLQNRP